MLISSMIDSSVRIGVISAGDVPDDVAEKIGYSERQMYRISREIVDKIKRES
jgi:hypothetical protein